MTAYLTAEDIIAKIGEEAFVLLADRDRDGAPDTAAVDRAVADASAMIEAHLGRYTLPLPAVPTILNAVGVDLAIWELAKGSRGQDSEGRRDAYKDAMAILKRIADGVMDLPGQPSATGGPGPGTATFTPGGPRLFGRGKGLI